MAHIPSREEAGRKSVILREDVCSKHGARTDLRPMRAQSSSLSSILAFYKVETTVTGIKKHGKVLCDANNPDLGRQPIDCHVDPVKSREAQRLPSLEVTLRMLDKLRTTAVRLRQPTLLSAHCHLPRLIRYVHVLAQLQVNLDHSIRHEVINRILTVQQLRTTRLTIRRVHGHRSYVSVYGLD